MAFESFRKAVDADKTIEAKSPTPNFYFFLKKS